jgi:hypothetical protein
VGGAGAGGLGFPPRRPRGRRERETAFENQLHIQSDSVGVALRGYHVVTEITNCSEKRCYWLKILITSQNVSVVCFTQLPRALSIVRGKG